MTIYHIKTKKVISQKAYTFFFDRFFCEKINTTNDNFLSVGPTKLKES